MSHFGKGRSLVQRISIEFLCCVPHCGKGRFLPSVCVSQCGTGPIPRPENFYRVSKLCVSLW